MPLVTARLYRTLLLCCVCWWYSVAVKNVPCFIAVPSFNAYCLRGGGELPNPRCTGRCFSRTCHLLVQYSGAPYKGDLECWTPVVYRGGFIAQLPLKYEYSAYCPKLPQKVSKYSQVSQCVTPSTQQCSIVPSIVSFIY